MKKSMITALSMLSLCFSLHPAQAFESEMTELMRSLDGKSSHIDGPNCWNTALVLNGLKSGFRFAHPQEWLLSLEENCREVEEPLYGDIGRLYHAQKGEIHGFIHIDEETIFAKHGEDADHGHQFMSYEKMLNQYGRDRNCKIQGDYSTECFHIMKFYRCEAKEDLTGLVDQLDIKIEQLLFSSETKWKYKASCEDSIFKKREELLQEMIIVLDQIKESGEIVSPHIYEAIKHQLYNIRVSFRVFKCDSRTQRDALIKRVQSLVKSFKTE